MKRIGLLAVVLLALGASGAGAASLPLPYRDGVRAVRDHADAWVAQPKGPDRYRIDHCERRKRSVILCVVEWPDVQVGESVGLVTGVVTPVTTDLASWSVARRVSQHCVRVEEPLFGPRYAAPCLRV